MIGYLKAKLIPTLILYLNKLTKKYDMLLDNWMMTTYTIKTSRVLLFSPTPIYNKLILSDFFVAN